MIRRQIVRWVAAVAGLFLAAELLPGIQAAAPEALLAAGTALWLLGLLLRPLLILLTLPVNLLTLGLFSLIVNTWMVSLAARLTPGLAVHGFGTAFLAALIVSGLGLILRALAGER